MENYEITRNKIVPYVPSDKCLHQQTLNDTTTDINLYFPIYAPYFGNVRHQRKFPSDNIKINSDGIAVRSDGITIGSNGTTPFAPFAPFGQVSGVIYGVETETKDDTYIDCTTFSALLIILLIACLVYYIK